MLFWLLFLILSGLVLLLVEPGGLPGPLLTGTVGLGGGVTLETSSFSDFRLTGAENIKTISTISF